MSNRELVIRWLLAVALGGFGVYVAVARSIVIGVTTIVIALLAILLAYAGTYPFTGNQQSRH